MARVVYLHVGAPKTGTTYLQDRLARNRSALADHGVHYPIGLHSDMFGAAIDLLDKGWGKGVRENARGEWDALMGRVRRANGTVIISHEILAGARPDQVARAMADLADAEVHLVYSARDLARQIPAEWQEGIKHQRRRPFARFLTEIQKSPRRNADLWFWRVQGLPDVLARWSTGLPPERVHLVVVPPSGAPRDLLWERYCTAFGIDPSWAPEEAARENVSIGIDETALLMKLNRRLKRAGLPSDDYRTLVRQLVVHQTLAHREDMRKATLPPRLQPWVDEVTAEWLEWIEGAGIDVVGDVDELRSLPLPEGAAWKDPDRPRNDRMVDAALDALVAVIMEAAGRPDPANRPVARLGRAARRLRGQ